MYLAQPIQKPTVNRHRPTRLLPVNDVVRDPVNDVLSELVNDAVRDHIPRRRTGATIKRYSPPTYIRRYALSGCLVLSFLIHRLARVRSKGLLGRDAIGFDVLQRAATSFGDTRADEDDTENTDDTEDRKNRVLAH